MPKKLRFPLASGNVVPTALPRRDEDGCIMCGRGFEDGVVYCVVGVVLDADRDNSALETIWYIGYHSPATDVSGCGDVDIIDHVRGGQFDLSFCTTGCLRDFFMHMVDELEAQL